LHIIVSSFIYVTRVELRAKEMGQGDVLSGICWGTNWELGEHLENLVGT